jgi:predicted enzyme involved in methoxymalonyl-ACP biosynthesis
LCRSENCVRLAGTFIPTSKNGLVVELYERLGFSQTDSNGGQTLWELRMTDDLPALPHFIRRETAHG